MDLHNLKDGRSAPGSAAKLNSLLHQAMLWNALDADIKSRLPANLHAHLRVACIQNGELIIHVSGPMADTRLRMLLPALLPEIRQRVEIEGIRTKIKPLSPAPQRENPLRLSSNARQTLHDAAQRLQRQPALAQALLKLAKKSP